MPYPLTLIYVIGFPTSGMFDRKSDVVKGVGRPTKMLPICWTETKKGCGFKKGCMQHGPRAEKCPIAIQFLATYVIVMCL